MVSDVFCKYYESNGNVCNSDGRDVSAAELLKAAESGDEGKLGNREEGVDVYAALEKVCEVVEVDNLESLNVFRITDYGKYSRNSITCENTHDKGNKANHLFAECSAKHCNSEGYKTADESDIGRGYNNVACVFDESFTAVLDSLNGICNNGCNRFCNFAAEKVADSVACKGKTDDSNCRADNNSGHKLVNPVYADSFNDKSDDYVNKTC